MPGPQIANLFRYSPSQPRCDLQQMNGQHDTHNVSTVHEYFIPFAKGQDSMSHEARKWLSEAARSNISHVLHSPIAMHLGKEEDSRTAIAFRLENQKVMGTTHEKFVAQKTTLVHASKLSVSFGHLTTLCSTKLVPYLVYPHPTCSIQKSTSPPNVSGIADSKKSSSFPKSWNKSSVLSVSNKDNAETSIELFPRISSKADSSFMIVSRPWKKASQELD